MVSLRQTEYDGTGKTRFPEPDITIDVRDTFGIDIDWQVPAFSLADERVPDLATNYVFDPDTTLAILAGFAHNRRVMVQGYQGRSEERRVGKECVRTGRSRWSP